MKLTRNMEELVKIKDLKQRYYAKFNEYFTISRENPLPREEIFEQIEKCIKDGKNTKKRPLNICQMVIIKV